MKPPIKNLTAVQRAYIAGIVDGEGHLAISKGPARKKNGERSPYYLCYCKIGSTDPNLLIWIQEVTGYGTIYREGRFSFDNPTRKPFYTWHISNTQLDNLLGQIYDYLIIKKHQADLILKMRKTINRRRSRGVPVSQEELAIRQACFEELRDHHKRRYIHDSLLDMP